jgi:hypothetical protein
LPRMRCGGMTIVGAAAAGDPAGGGAGPSETGGGGAFPCGGVRVEKAGAPG